MELMKFLKLSKVKPDNEASIYEFIGTVSLIQEENVQRAQEIFDSNGFSFEAVPCSFLKIYTKDAKELEDVNQALAMIKEMNLKDLFMNDLKLAHFTLSFVQRVKWCLDHNLAITNEDGTFLSMLNNSQSFGEYSRGVPLNEVKSVQIEEVKLPEETYLDIEDLQLKSEMINRLNNLRLEDMDGSLGFIIDHILNNLDMAIKEDNKNYRENGLKSIIQKAIGGLILTSDMQELLNSKIYPTFDDLNQNYGRGEVA